MSYRAQVTDTPVQLVYGSQRENVTLTNVGANTVYLSNDSSVTTGNDLVLDAGGSILVEPKTIIWGVCGTGLSSQIAVTSSVGERFAYSSQAVKVISQTTALNLGNGIGSGNTYSQTIRFDNSFSTQYAAIGIYFAASVASNIYIIWNNTTAGGQQFVSVRTGTAAASNTLSPQTGAIFPVKGFGGQFIITADTNIGNVVITVVGYPVAPYQYPIAVNDPKNLAGAWNGASGAWTYSQASQAISTTNLIYLPAITGSARLSLNVTQSAGGTVTYTPQILRTINGAISTFVPLQYDTAQTTTLAATSLLSWNWSNVPPSIMRLQIATDATATLGQTYINVDTNK